MKKVLHLIKKVNPNLFIVKNVHPHKCITCKDKVPVYNYAGEKKGIYCNDCKKDNMINIKDPKCVTCKLKIPSFNYVGEKKGLIFNINILSEAISPNIQSYGEI